MRARMTAAVEAGIWLGDRAPQPTLVRSQRTCLESAAVEQLAASRPLPPAASKEAPCFCTRFCGIPAASKGAGDYCASRVSRSPPSQTRSDWVPFVSERNSVACGPKNQFRWRGYGFEPSTRG